MERSGTLTYQDIADSMGVTSIEELEEIELLFLSFHELSSLHFCHNLRKLTLIDNGLRVISNLSPVGPTLVSLCLCDQRISKMENLDLPNLRELFLHRNQISKIENLNKCPRLRKIWLFQNQIKEITELHSVPELEECWLQSNQIKKLSGFEHNKYLRNISLAANPINDLKEFTKLMHISQLNILNFSDVHFGRSPIIDEPGYKEWVVLNLPQVKLLDGVQINQSTFTNSEEVYFSQLRAYNNSLLEIEDQYQKELRMIEAQHQSRESHSNVLEKEMIAALKELQGLVYEGRSVIHKQISRSQQLLQTNMENLQKSLNDLEISARTALGEDLRISQQEFDTAASILLLLESISQLDAKILTTLSTLSKSQNTFQHQQLLFQTLPQNSADFQFISSLISTVTVKPKSKISGSPRVDLEDLTGPAGQQPRVELSRAYKVTYPSVSEQEGKGLGERAFTVVPVDQLQVVLSQGWTSLGNTSTVVLCQDVGIAASLGEDEGLTLSQEQQKFASLIGATSANNVNNTSSNNSPVSLGSPVAGKSGFAGLGAAVSAGGFNMPRLRESLQKQLFVVVCGRLHLNHPELKNMSTVPMSWPTTEDVRRRVWKDMHSLPKATHLRLKQTLNTQTQNLNTQTQTLNPKDGNSVWVLPSSLIEKCFAVDTVALCLRSPKNDLEASPISTDTPLEALLLPSHGIDRATNILTTFQRESGNIVKRFIEQLLEEVDGSQADLLREAEKEVSYREQSLKRYRTEIEVERKQQELLLKEMKQQQILQSEGNGNPGMSRNPSRKQY